MVKDKYGIEWLDDIPELDPASDRGASRELASGWSIPWSDLMMVMFILFVVLFVYARNHGDVRVIFRDPDTNQIGDTSRNADQGRVTAAVDPIEGLIGRIQGDQASRSLEGFTVVGGPEVFYKSQASGVSVVREQGNRLRITLRGDIFFTAGQSELNPGAVAYLAEVSELLRLSSGPVEIVGYVSQEEADSASGFTLSAARAASVARYFIQGLGLEPARVTVAGRSDQAPEVPTTSGQHENVNRRVDIVIHTGV